MKKLISFVLAAAMLVSLVPTFAFATEAEPQSGNTVTLFDFGNPATFSTVNYSEIAAKPSALCYDGKDSSLRWEMDITSTSDGDVSNTPELDLVYTATDLSNLSDDAVINVRFYSENAGSKFNLVYYGSEGIGWKDTNDDGKSDLLVSYNEAVTINGGWQVHSMSLDTLLERFRNYTEDNKITVRFNDDGWSNLEDGGYNDGDTLYIDEIWVDANPNAYYDNLGTDTKLLWEATDKAENAKVSIDTDRNIYEEYTLNNVNHEFATLDDSTKFATSDYTWVNMWIYSDKAQQNGMYFTLYGSYTNGTATGSVIRFPIQKLDWTGWKLVSFNIADDRVSADSGLAGDVTKLRFDVGKWDNLTAVNKATGSVTFGLDGVWLSNTSAQAAYEEALSYGNTAALNANVIYSKDFNTKSSIIRPNTSYHVTNDVNASYNPYNSRLYDMSARLSFNSVTYNDILNLNTRVANAKTASLQVLDRKSAGATMLAVTNNSYLNAWIYNPEPKYTFDGVTPAEFVIVLGHRGANGTDSSTSYSYVAVRADWSGWKLISIPVSTWGTNFATNGIAQIYISCNMDRYSRETSGAPKIVTRTDNNGYVRLLSGGGHNVFSRKYTLTKTDGVITAASDEVNANYYNYIDVERVWITDGPVTDELNVTAADNSAIRCSETSDNDVTLFTAEADTISSSSVNVIKTIDGVTSKATASYTNGVLTFDNFEYGATYSVVADITGTNGVKKVVDFTFTNEDYHVITTEDNTSIAVTLHGNLPADYENALVVAAVYTSGGTELVSADPAYIDELTGTITANVGALDNGQTVKFIFINNMNDIKPLEFNIQK